MSDQACVPTKVCAKWSIGWIVAKTIHTSGGDVVDVLPDIWESRADAEREMSIEKKDSARYESFAVHPVGGAPEEGVTDDDLCGLVERLLQQFERSMQQLEGAPSEPAQEPHGATLGEIMDALDRWAEGCLNTQETVDVIRRGWIREPVQEDRPSFQDVWSVVEGPLHDALWDLYYSVAKRGLARSGTDGPEPSHAERLEEAVAYLSDYTGGVRFHRKTCPIAQGGQGTPGTLPECNCGFWDVMRCLRETEGGAG